MLSSAPSAPSPIRPRFHLGQGAGYRDLNDWYTAGYGWKSAGGQRHQQKGEIVGWGDLRGEERRLSADSAAVTIFGLLRTALRQTLRFGVKCVGQNVTCNRAATLFLGVGLTRGKLKRSYCTIG